MFMKNNILKVIFVFILFYQAVPVKAVENFQTQTMQLSCYGFSYSCLATTLPILTPAIISDSIYSVKEPPPPKSNQPSSIGLFLLIILFFAFLGFGLFSFRLKQIKEKELVRLLDIKTKELKDNFESLLSEKTHLESAKIKEEEANKLKSAILSKISHELRTPMNNILGFAYLLSLKANEQDSKKMAGDILNSGSKLMETLDSLLDLAQFEKTSAPVNIQDLKINDVIDELFKKFSHLAKNKGIVFNYEAGEDIYVFANKASFSKALENIIENAIKFTNAGEVTVSLSKKEVDDQKLAIIKVKDTGIGIEHSHIKKIFEPMTHIKDGFKDSFEGTGLNLVYSKKTIELFKGEIKVESKPGEGSIFTIILPLSTRLHPVTEPAVKKAVSPAKEPVEVKTLQDLPELLLVEDNILNKELINLYLLGLYKIDYAPDGYWAIRMCNKKIYTGILMDINLKSDMDGLQATKVIRQIPGYQDIPIAAVTGYISSDDIAKIYASDCSHYLGKPFDRNALLNLLTNMFPEFSSQNKAE
jgi:signal transduction histidine kinase